MRSAMMVCSAPRSRSTPWMRMVEVPAPSIFAPILISRSARSTTSGSRAALRSTVSPLASTAAIIRSSVPVTVMRSKWTVRAAQAVGRHGFDVAVRLMDRRAQLFQAEDVQVDGPRADGAAARQRNARAAAARHQRPQHQAGRAHGLDQLVRRFRADDALACAAGRVSPSTSTLAPISTSRRCMVRMSRTRGMRCSVTGSSVSSAAASAGSAEFFEPLVGISPVQRRCRP